MIASGLFARGTWVLIPAASIELVHNTAPEITGVLSMRAEGK